MDLTKQFIEERTYLHGVSSATVQWYRSSFKAFSGALESKATILERLKTLQQGNSNISVNTYLRAVNAYFMWLHKEHGKELIRIPRLKEEQKILATFRPEHINAFVHWKPVKSSELRLRTLALTAMDTGMRVDELLRLTRPDVDFDQLLFRVKGKGNKHRLVPMSIELRKVLYRYQSKRQQNLLFCTRDGTELSQRNLLRDFKAVCTKLGISGVRCSFHTLRHSFAVNYLRNGGNLYYLQRILGHTSINTTERYLRSLGIEDLNAVHNQLSLLAR